MFDFHTFLSVRKYSNTKNFLNHGRYKLQCSYLFRVWQEDFLTAKSIIYQFLYVFYTIAWHFSTFYFLPCILVHCKKDWWMVTLVADKLRRLWLWEVVGIAKCISNLSPNRTLQQPEHLWGSQYNYTSKMLIKAGDFHGCSVITISARSWLLLHAFWYKPVCDTFLSGY